MSEIVKYSGNIVPLPRSPEELYAYFRLKEESSLRQGNTGYTGYAGLAAEAADAIQLTRSRKNSEEPLAIDIALIPGHSTGIYKDEFTDASRELQELIFSTAGLEPKIDETSDSDPAGRIWWQSRNATMPVNLIETRYRDDTDDEGYLVRLTAVSEVPADLVDYSPAQRVYPPEAQRAIKCSRAIQKLASRAIGEAREAELEYYDFVQALPVANFESPYDQAA